MTLQFDNIFEALVDDPAEAADLQFRADLMMVIRTVIKLRGWSQAEAGRALGVPQPRVSDIMRGRIGACSSDRLIGHLARLGISMRPQMGPTGKVECAIVQPA